MGTAPARTSLLTTTVVAALLLPGAFPAAAQDAAEDDHPRVEAVVFEGTRGVNDELLRDSIATRETRCRGLLLKPFCAFSDASAFVEKHDLDRRELALDAVRIRVIYYRLGYRGAAVATAVTPEDEGVRVTFDIDEGPLTTVGSLSVDRNDPVLDEGQIGRADLPDPGDALDLTRLDSASARIRTALWDRGYADAVVVDSADVDTVAHTAEVHVRVEPGRVATVGEVVVEGNEDVSTYTIQRLFALKPGDVYRRTELTAAQRRLYESELFRQSLVEVPEVADSSKTLVITVREAPMHALRAGPGFNTVDYLQGETRYTHYDFLGGARRLDVRAAVGNILAPQLHDHGIFRSTLPRGVGDDVDEAFLSPTWQVGVDLTQPFFLSPQTSLGVGVSAHRRSIPGIVIDHGFTVNAAVTHRVAPDLPVSLSYHFERTRIEAGEVYFCVSFGVCDPPTIATLGRPHRLAPVVLSANLDRSDDPLDPGVGWTAHAEIEHASRLTGSGFQHQRLAGDAARYQPVGTDGVLAFHVRGGWVRPLDGTRITFELDDEVLNILHPRRRFLAGGSRSVRGYAENQLGPRVLTIPASGLLSPEAGEGEEVQGCTVASIGDGSCDPNVAPSDAFQPRPLGGNTLVEGSVEYRRPLTGSITGAAFVDAGFLRGQRLNFPPGSRTAVTPGLGIRYLSPIGRVRLDLGIRTKLGEDLPVVTELVEEDGTRRLVQLETMKRYDPLEGSGGFFRQVLSRLQLHLALGEAW